MRSTSRNSSASKERPVPGPSSATSLMIDSRRTTPPPHPATESISASTNRNRHEIATVTKLKPGFRRASPVDGSSKKVSSSSLSSSSSSSSSISIHAKDSTSTSTSTSASASSSRPRVPLPVRTTAAAERRRVAVQQRMAQLAAAPPAASALEINFGSLSVNTVSSGPRVREEVFHSANSSVVISSASTSSSSSASRRTVPPDDRPLPRPAPPHTAMYSRAAQIQRMYDSMLDVQRDQEQDLDTIIRMSSLSPHDAETQEAHEMALAMAMSLAAEDQHRRVTQHPSLMEYGDYVPDDVPIDVLLAEEPVRPRRNAAPAVNQGTFEMEGTYEALLELEDVKQGLPQSRVNSFPICWVGETIDENATEFGSCCICMDEFQRGSEVRSLPCGHHEFCIECIDKWFEQNKRCPICKHWCADDS